MLMNETESLHCKVSHLALLNQLNKKEDIFRITSTFIEKPS